MNEFEVMLKILGKIGAGIWRRIRYDGRSGCMMGCNGSQNIRRRSGRTGRGRKCSQQNIPISIRMKANPAVK